MPRRWSFGERLRAALVVGGITLGIGLLFILQFALPYWIGPAGLVFVGLVDVAIYLEVRHRRVVRKRARMRKWAGGSVTHPKAPVKDEYATTIALLVFVVGFSVMGAALQANPGSLMNFLLFQVGAVLTIVAAVMWWPYEWRFRDWRSESDKYDTTDEQ